MMIPALVEHVALMEARPDFHVEKLFCLVVAPTRKLVKSLIQQFTEEAEWKARW
jgi:hypothetical protein